MTSYIATGIQREEIINYNYHYVIKKWGLLWQLNVWEDMKSIIVKCAHKSQRQYKYILFFIHTCPHTHEHNELMFTWVGIVGLCHLFMNDFIISIAAETVVNSFFTYTPFSHKH